MMEPLLLPKNLVVFLPTLNERDNLAYLLPRFERLPLPHFTLLVLDDSSRDGTQELLRNHRSGRFDVRLVVRQGVAGRGVAGRDAFRIATELDADVLVEMDADGSHAPEDIAVLLDMMAREGADVVLGSRRDQLRVSRDTRPFVRRFITAVSNAYARRLLAVPVWDCNSGFRCYSRRALSLLALSPLRALGTNIVHESLFKAYRGGARIVECPIDFYHRHSGRTTKRPRDFARAFLTCLALRTGVWDRVGSASPERPGGTPSRTPSRGGS